MATAKQRCAKTRWIGYDGPRSICSRDKNLVERDGKLWCWQHDPVAVEGRRNKRNEEFNAKFDAMHEAEIMVARRQVATEAILRMVHDHRYHIDRLLMEVPDKRSIIGLLDELKATGWQPKG